MNAGITHALGGLTHVEQTFPEQPARLFYADSLIEFHDPHLIIAPEQLL